MTTAPTPAPAASLTHAEFRGLIDPLLSALGFAAEQVVNCSFNADGFTVTLFHEEPAPNCKCREHEHAHRVLGRVTNAQGEWSYSGYAKVLVTVPVHDRTEDRPDAEEAR